MLTTLAMFGLPVAAQLWSLVWLAIIFFIIALVAWVMGAQGLAGMSAGVGRVLLFVFLILAIIFIIVGLTVHPASAPGPVYP